MTELFPVVAGLVSGTLLSQAFGGTRLRLLTVLVAVAIGASATLLSGEWLQSWDFLLVDIPEALVAALVGALMCDGFGSGSLMGRRALRRPFSPKPPPRRRF